MAGCSTSFTSYQFPIGSDHVKPLSVDFTNPRHWLPSEPSEGWLGSKLQSASPVDTYMFPFLSKARSATPAFAATVVSGCQLLPLSSDFHSPPNGVPVRS